MRKMPGNLNENPLAVKPVNRLIWIYAIPGIISQLVNSLHNIVDQVFLGWSPAGDLGIAATNIVYPIAAIITGISALIGMGAVSKFSILLGKQEKEGAADLLGNAICLLCVLGVAIAVIASIFLVPMLYLFGATDLILPYAKSYARIICLGVPFGLFATGMSYFIRADGNPNYASAVLLSGAIFNMIFDPVFLFLFHMGVAGVALATVLGQVLSFILALHYLRRRFSSTKIRTKNMRLQGPIVREIFSLGSAMFTTHILAIISQIILMNSLRHYGALSIYGSEAAIAASGAVGKLSIVLLSAIIGIAVGSQPILGFTLGAKQYERVRKTYLLDLKYGSIVALTAFLLLQLFPTQLLSIFGSEDPLFMAFGVRYIHIYLAMLFMNAIQPMTSTFCTSMGKAKLGFWMAVIRQGVLLMPLMLILPLFLGIDGVLAAGAISDGVAGSIALTIGLREVRRLKEMEAAAAE